MLHPRLLTPLAATLVAGALLVLGILLFASAGALAQTISPPPAATPIVIKGPTTTPVTVTPSYPAPPSTPQSIILRGVPVLSIPNFTSGSLANSRAAKKALLAATMPAQNRGEQAGASGSPQEIAADLDRVYAARTAETQAHRLRDGPGLLVRLRAAR